MKRLAAFVLATAVALASCAHPSDGDVAVVTRDDLVLAVTATGTLAALDSTDVLPPQLSDTLGFKIASLVPEGTAVVAGDPIATFDTSDFDRQLADLQLQLEASTKQLAKRRQEIRVSRASDDVTAVAARADVAKAEIENQAPPELSSAIDVKQREMQLEVDRMAAEEAQSNAATARGAYDAELRALEGYVASTEHRVAQLQYDIAHMAVTAPRAGEVVYTGEKVGGNVWYHTAVAKVVGLGAFAGNATVDEVDIPRVAPGQAVTLRLDSMPDVTLHGHVTSIGTSVQPRPEDPSKVLPLVIAVDPSGAALRPGMRFRGRIEIARIPGVVQVPAEAVFVTAAGPVAYRDDGERVALLVGRRSSDAIEVIGGLAPGDRVMREPGGQP